LVVRTAARPGEARTIAVSTDAISIVEAAYDLEGDGRAWFRRVLDRLGPKLDQGFGVSASMYWPGMRPDESWVDFYKMEARFIEAANAMIMAYPEIFHRVLRAPGPPHSTPSEGMGLTIEQAATWQPYVEFLHGLGVRDVVGVLCRDPTGRVTFFSAPMAEVRRPTRQERAMWGRLAAHLGAGARLGREAGMLERKDVSEGSEAVLSPGGAVVHAEGVARGQGARDALRRAAKAIDGARSKARGDEDEALELWQGLVAGRWSLIDQFDTDGRRFLVARRNDPPVSDPRALSLRERQVLSYAAMGHSLKLTAYALGLSASAIAACRARGMRKLRLRTKADLVRLFSTEPAVERADDEPSASSVASRSSERRDKLRP
jgi:DNA-binding CsgD family transcriptional regulator